MKAFFILMGGLAVIFLCSACYADESTDQYFDLRVKKSRTADQTNLNDLILLFGDKLPHSQVCYQSAVSNYIEDKWLAMADKCASKDVPCGNGQNVMNKEIAKITEGLASDLRASGKNTDSIADSIAPNNKSPVSVKNSLYMFYYIQNVAEQLSSQIDPQDELNAFWPTHRRFWLTNVQPVTDDESKKQQDEFNGYLNVCAAHPPASWSVVGTPFTDNQARAAGDAKLMAQEILMEHLIASQLPKDDRGYVGCLSELNKPEHSKLNGCNDLSCAEIISTDTKQNLIDKLDAFKAQQCDMGALTAKMSALKSRAALQRKISDLILLFGDKLPASPLCYQSAVSSYVEDKWNAFMVANDCVSNKKLCNNVPKEQAKTLEQWGENAGDKINKQKGIVFQNDWYIASLMYHAERSLAYQIDPENDAYSTDATRKNQVPKEFLDMTSDEKKQQLDEFNGYLNSCNGRQPAPWAIAGGVASEDPSSTAIKLGIQSLLTDHLIASQLPKEDEGYIGCLGTLLQTEISHNECADLSCAANVQTDDKTILMSQLNDLKAHACSPVYAYQMVSQIKPSGLKQP